MNYKNGITINDMHTYRDFGLVIDGIEEFSPERKTNFIEVPGMDGLHDFSELLTGKPQFKNRKKVVTLVVSDKNKMNHSEVYSKLLNTFHNKRAKLIFDDDANYFYLGRLNIETKHERNSPQVIILEIDADPFKYEVASSLEDWDWDTFDFEDGVIREYGNIAVIGTVEVQVIGSPLSSHPVIESSGPVKVTIEGQTFNLKKGRETLYDIILEDKEYTFTFTGNAVISIDYRGGKL